MAMFTARVRVVEPRRLELDLAGLSRPVAKELLALGESRFYTDGSEAFAQGEPMPGVFVVARGTLKVLRSKGSKIQITEMLAPGSSIGQVEALDGGLATCSALAVGETACWLIPPERLRALAGRNSEVALWMLQCSAYRIRRLVTLVDALSLRTVPERVAGLILDLYEQNPVRPLVEFRETQEEASQCIGASREAFSRALRSLADLGMIRNSFPVVRILELAELRHFAWGSCRCAPPPAVGPLMFEGPRLLAAGAQVS